jgi:hypothetical protein
MPQKIDISLRIPGTMSIADLMPLIRDVENAGFHGAGILDASYCVEMCLSPWVRPPCKPRT